MKYHNIKTIRMMLQFVSINLIILMIITFQVDDVNGFDGLISKSLVVITYYLYLYLYQL